MGGMRGGTATPDKPLRGNAKTAFALIDKALTIADGVVRSRLGDEAGIMPAERVLIAEGAAGYLQDGQVSKLVKYIGPASLVVGLGLWAWRCYDQAQANKAHRSTAPANPLVERLRAARAPRPDQAAAVEPTPTVEGFGTVDPGFDLKALVEG